MKNKGSILRASLLVITLFVATFAGFVDIADAADFASTVVSPGIAAEDTIIEISINVTNNDAVNNVTEVRIDGNGNFTDFACPNPLYGLVDDWDLTASGNNYCKYLRSLNSGIENGNTETFTINATTPSGSGNSSFEVRAYLANWQSTYPELEIDADGPVILMDEPLDNDWTDSLAFDIDTVSINDSSNIVGNCSVVFTDNDSVAHDLGEVEYAAGACDDEVTLPNGTAEGLGTLTVSIEDEWGHVGSNTTLFGYDTVAPTSSVLPMPTYTTDCDSVPIQISFDDNTGNTSINLDRIRVNVTNTDVWATYESNDPNFDGVINSDLCALGDGTLEFYAFGRDNAGNEESIPLSADTTTFMDTAAPDFNITIPSDGDWVNDGTFTVETTNITETGSGVVDYCEVVYQDANGNTTLGNITYDGSACSGPISISNDTANGMGTLYVYVYDLAGNKGGGRSAGDDFIDLGFDDDAPYVFIDVEPSGPQDPGALAYNATVCDAGIGINDSTIAVRINENGIQGWVEQTPVLTPNATCYFVSGAIEANLRKTGESYSIDLYVSDNSSNSDTYEWYYYVRDQYELPTLKYGKNLISTPLIPEDSNITRILDTNVSKVDKIYWYDPVTETFKVHYPAVPALSDLTTLEAGKGYWFYVNTEYDQTIYGTSEQGDTPALYDFADGANMVGFKTKVVEPIEDRIVSGAISDVLVTWNTTDWVYPDQGDNLTIGRGYWLYGQGAGTYR